MDAFVSYSPPVGLLTWKFEKSSVLRVDVFSIFSRRQPTTDRRAAMQESDHTVLSSNQ